MLTCVCLFCIILTLGTKARLNPLVELGLEVLGIYGF